MIDDLKQRARRLIQDSFANVESWGWKDPRSCLTLPFWQQLLPDMRYIVCLRNPVDVARSLEQRDSLSAEKSSHLWLTYVNSALEHSDGRPRLVIFYEDLMDDCLRELQRLAEFLGKPERAEQVDVQEAVQEFIEKGLQHYRTSIVQATASPRIALRARALYIAQRISVSFGRKEINGQQGLDHQIEKALDILSQYSFKASGQANPLIEQLAELEDQLAESGNSVRDLQTGLLEREKEVETISARLAEREEALKMLSIQLAEKDGIVQTLSAELVEKDGALQTLSTQLAEKDGALQTLSTQLAEKDGALQTLSTQLVEKDETLQTLSTLLVEKDETLQTLSTLLVEKDEALQTLSTQLVEKYEALQTLSTLLVEKDGALQTLSAELAEQSRALQSQAEREKETVDVLSAQLLDTETQLKRIKDTLGWRLLSHYGRIKYRFLLPVYRLFGQVSTEPTETAPLHDNPESVISVDQGAALRSGDGPPRREKRSVRKS